MSEENESAAVAAIETFVARSSAPVSEYDIAAGTGIGVGTVSRLLYAIMRRYECALRVREDGTIVYDFGGALRPLGRPTWRQRLRRWGRRIWRGFSTVYRASLAVVLVGYAVTFVLLLIAAAVAAAAAAEDEGPVEGAFHLVGAVFRAIFEFTTHSALVYADLDTRGYRHRRYEPNQPVLPNAKRPEHDKSFVASVYDFVLGPDRVPVRDGAQEREVAAFVRRNRGLLTIADIQALSGMSRADAERFFARFVARFEGEAEITEDGALYARFDALLRSATTAGDADVVHFWDEYEPPYLLTGNTTGRNVGIGLLAAFNLAGAVAVQSAAAALGAAGVWLGAVPLVLFALFFAIPLARWPWVRAKNREQHRTNVRKRIYRAVFEDHADAVPFEEIVSRANTHRTTEESLDAGAMQELLEHTAYELGGHFEVDDDGRRAMALEALRREMNAADTAEPVVVNEQERVLVHETVA